MHKLIVLFFLVLGLTTLQAKQPLKIQVNAGPDVSICRGDSVLLSGTGSSGTYSWTPSTGLASPGTPVTWAKPNSTTQYILFGTNAAGNITRDTVVITVFIPVSVDAGFGQTVCFGDSVNLLAQTPVPVSSYLWSPAGTLSSSTIANPVAYPVDTTFYTVTITDANGCKNKDSVLVTVLFSPIQFMQDTSACPNDTVFLRASGGVSYSWQPTLNMSNSISANPYVYPPKDTTYTVTVTDSLGCTFTDSVDVSLFPSVLVSAGRDTAIYCRDSVQLFGTGGVSYEWVPGLFVHYYNSQNPIAVPWWTTDYVMIATDGNGCKWTDQVKVTLIDHQLDVMILQPDTVICPGDTLQLDAIVSHPVVAYHWYPPEANFSAPGAPSSLLNPPYSMQVGLWVEDSIHCKDLFNRNIILDSYVVQTIPDSAVCEGQTVHLTTNGGLTFQYSWSPDTGLSGNTVPEPFVVASQSVTYTVDVIDSLGCHSSDAVTLTVNPKPEVNAGMDKEICEGESATLNGSGDGSLIWNPFTDLSDPFSPNPVASPASSALYVLTAINQYGCQEKDEVYVKVYPKPAIFSTVNGPTLCQGDSIQTNILGAASVFQWYPASGVSDPAAFDPYLFPQQTTDYTIVGSTQFGCSDTAYVTVWVNPTPVPVITAPEGVCQNTNGILSVEGGNSFQWSTGEMAQSITVAPAVNTWYSVTSYDAFTGCGGNSDSVFVASWTVPVAGLSYSIPAFFSPVSASFNNLSTGAQTYTWHFMPDDVLVYDANPVYDFSRNGEHVVILTATSNHGCKDSVSQRIFLERPTLYLPSAFSPNGDTFDDTYHIGTYGVERVEAQIYDRWGVEVFFAENKDFQWDGKNKKGQDLPEGVYIIKIKSFKLNGQTEQKEGTITLLR